MNKIILCKVFDYGIKLLETTESLCYCIFILLFLHLRFDCYLQEEEEKKIENKATYQSWLEQKQDFFKQKVKEKKTEKKKKEEEEQSKLEKAKETKTVSS